MLCWSTAIRNDWPADWCFLVNFSQRVKFWENPAINTKKGFIKGEALRLLRTNSGKENFYKHKRDFEQRVCNKGYPTALVHTILTEVQFSDRTEALTNKTKKAKEILPFVTTYNLATPNLKRFP